MNKFLPLLILIFISCSKGGDSRLAEQAEIQSQQDVEAQNNNQRTWAEKMEIDLNKRKNFFKAIAGEFEGSVEIEGILFNLSAKFLPSIPISFPNRVRTLEEINFELQSLTLNMHIKLENPRVNNSGVSCTIENYRPDVLNGVLNIISEKCKNIFNFTVTDEFDLEPTVERETRARELARELTSGRLLSVNMLDGFFESGISSKKYRFFLKRSL